MQRLKQRQFVDSVQSTLDQASYAYDANNNITQITRVNGDFDYGYDVLDRLGKVSSLLEHREYQYDGVGNRTQISDIKASPAQANAPLQETREEFSAAYSYRNQLLRYGNASYEQDANGHTIERVDVYQGQVRKTTYQYNTQERLVAVYQGLDAKGQTPEQLEQLDADALKAQAADIGSIVVANYRYNAYGQRVSKTINGQTTFYLYSPQSTWMTNPLLQKRNNKFYYYLNDHLGTPQLIVDKNSKVV